MLGNSIFLSHGEARKTYNKAKLGHKNNKNGNSHLSCNKIHLYFNLPTCLLIHECDYFGHVIHFVVYTEQ